MVIRDLTLRSAASFGSFHLIRLLYDEYMFYLVEHRVAEATGETPIAVMGEVRAAPWRGAGVHGRSATLAAPGEDTCSQSAGAHRPGCRAWSPVTCPLRPCAGVPASSEASDTLFWGGYCGQIHIT